MEGIVLLRIQHFQQCCCGIALEIGCNLIDLIQYKHRIGCTCFEDILNNASRHRPDIGASVTANLGLVVQTAQRHANIFTVQRLCHRFTQRGFSHPRRTVKADNGRLHVSFQFQYSQVLDDTFFYLFESVVVSVQYLLGMLQIKIIFAVFVPRKIYECLHILGLNREIGALRMQPLQLSYFFFEGLGNFGRPFLLGCFGLQRFYLLLVDVSTQLLLNGLDLLLQEILSLLLVDILMRFQLDGILQLQKLVLAIQDKQQSIGPFLQIANQ